MSVQKSVLHAENLAQFCKRWDIKEFAVFGSALRDDFDAESDLDVMVAFAPGSDWGLLDHLRMEQELAELFDRKVDLFSRRAVEQSHNPMRREAILNSAEIVYVAR